MIETVAQLRELIVALQKQIGEPAREGLSIAEACFSTGLGKTSLYDAIADGRLPARKYGKRTIILRSELRAFLASLPRAA